MKRKFRLYLNFVSDNNQSLKNTVNRSYCGVHPLIQRHNRVKHNQLIHKDESWLSYLIKFDY